MSRKIQVQELLERSKQEGKKEGFVDGAVTATCNAFLDMLRRFPIEIQNKIILNVSQWHNTQENDPDGGSIDKGQKDGPRIVRINDAN